MKLISYYSASFRAFSIIIVMLLGVMVQSCTKEKIGKAALVNVGTVRFNANAYTIQNKATDPIVVTLPLSLPLEKESTVLVSVDNSSTVSSSDYSISPAIPASGLLVTLPKGATEISFTVTSLSKYEGDKTLVLSLSSPTGGVLVANINATTTITVKGDPIIYPEIQTSVPTLSFANTISGQTSPSKSYTVKAIRLTADVNVEASENFEVSLNNVNFSNTLTIPIATLSNGALVTVYTRFTALTGQNKTVTGTITHSSGTVPENSLAVNGVEYGVASVGVLIMKEDFNYGAAAGNLTAVSNGNWTVFGGTTVPIPYSPNGLTFSGYAGSNVGGSVFSQNGSGAREDDFTSFTKVTSGVVYAAQLVNVATAGTSADFFSGLRDPAIIGSYFNRLNVKDDGSGKPTFGIGKSSSTAVYASGTYSYGTTYLVVTKYDFDTGFSSMYVLSAAPTKYEPAVPNATTNTGSGPAALGNIFLRQNTTGNLGATFDGVRIATSWKEAVGL